MSREFPQSFQVGREAVHKMQHISLEAPISGMHRNRDRKELAESFADYALEQIKKMGKEKSSPFSILPEYQSEVYTLFQKVVKMHALIFARVNKDNVNGTIFDLNDKTAETKTMREEYIVALLMIAFENVITLRKSDEKAFKLTTYRDPEWIRDWMNGSTIRQQLGKKYSIDEVENFIKNYISSARLHTAIGNIRNPESALDRIAENFIVKLSDENIKKHFQGRLSTKQIEKFISSYPPFSRIKTAVMNINDTEKALDRLAEGKIVIPLSGGKRFSFTLEG